jgi:hypothetical protein
MPRSLTWHRLLWALFFVVLVVGGALWSARSWQHTSTGGDNGQSSLPVFEFVTFTPAPTGVMSSDLRATMMPKEKITLTVTPTVTIVPPGTPVKRSE